ncbi:rhomboid family intramembrane serine protease [Corynebacterium yudongzhengii]|uniref:rhomboid family intramembrane serine protease n=1 Tax=Corynebacterium yudongzhengii TaxID=2080740 RepID=UPI001F4546DF|nr:rhomboid family intramembrane serine protease [Corynebacterium yudongzhengii]
MRISQWLRGYARQAPVCLFIVVACSAVAVVAMVQRLSFTGLQASGIGAHMILWGPLSAGADYGWIRVLTSGFLHLDIGHLAINMFLLILIGREVERHIGHALFAATYLVSVVGASAAVLAFTPHVPTAGASGALYSLMAIFVAVTAARGGDLRAPLVLVAANVAYSLLVPGISLVGHLGGLVVGAVLAWFVVRSRGLGWAAVAVVGLACVVVCWWLIRAIAVGGVM